HLAAHAVLAALGLELALVAEVDQGVEVLVGQQPDVAALAAVAAVRPAQRDELLAPEAHAAVAAVAGSDGDFSFVDQLHEAGTRGMGNEGSGQCKGACGREASTTPLIPFTPLIPRLRNKKPRRSGAPRNRWGYPQAAGTTLTVRRFFAPLIANSTVPSTSANRVWSRPRPTPGPGWNWVPRWRTMMLPASMAWPPYIFTPRYFGLESRPLREEPTPFLCAMAASPYFLSPPAMPVISISV